ncbi:hypothetical protein G3I51_24020 [Streptomyces sp. SID9944]|nr:hypothetical protein [Streptomyces sp. SID9944]
MTPADELRAAADKLRHLAATASDDSGSPHWTATRHFPDQPDSGFTSLWAAGGRPLLAGGGGRGRPPAYVSAPVGDYIAAMGPGVGAALADWLTEYAASLDKATHPEWQETVAPRPLAVARAILGGAR